MTMLGRPSLFFLLLMLLSSCLAIPAQGDVAEAYHGTVIDAETKRPIEDAVVVVVWYRKPIVTMNGPQYFHNAFEVLTDAEGKFSITADSGIDWNPLTFVLKRPRIVIFKPGYGPYPVAHVSPPRMIIRNGQEIMLNWDSELLKGTVVELPELRQRTKGELWSFTSPDSLSVPLCRHGKYDSIDCVPPEWVPNFVRLLNVQQRNVGAPLSPGSK